ncbi:uncharacterized protein B0I36DRAFT_22665 [Microdochium trichocladiopsis]|uniref:PX-associated-domain-containing protein n=1 Tax=Microdochium trichocladiopsis TaxID=1682393 RepID=A0A9P9BX97_9PEZI|nr:uncharacterized protein B0I36DRAFT_22665 [Microdochium trichocladiopsis]KAH7041370.1 hypothetical protein B0I36DRAFT_22665 [Microdochium trichocladiopsis]
MAPQGKQLSDRQLSALFNILVHHETYSEVEKFKDTIGIQGYGYPFVDQVSPGNDSTHDAALSHSPLLQLLLTSFVLSAPGFRDLPPEFWSVKFKGMMERFGKANLSESYDKGTLGTRKRLACAATVIHEGVTRGLLAGIPHGEKKPDLHKNYDLASATDITEAYEDALTALIHDDLVKELFDHLATTADFESHSPAVKGAMDYAIIHVATLLHYIFVLSAEGPYLVKMVENIHGLIPYNLIRQTLRVGNAATMINGMARLFLAKMGIGAMTNWFGLTKDASDGMNLMQRIISMVLDWDASDFRKAAARIRNADGHVNSQYLDAIDKHIQASREQQEEVREKSMRGNRSIIVAILESADLDVPEDFSAEDHQQCLDYYAAKLAVWDREVTIKATCEQSPDYITGMVRDSIKAFEPMLRSVHDNVDLKKLISAAENFMNDAIAVAKCQSPDNRQNKTSSKARSAPSKATVDDYVALLHRHKEGFMYDYLHNVAKSCPDIRDMWCAWISDIVKIFRDTYEPGSQWQVKKDTTEPSNSERDRRVSADSSDGVGRMSDDLQTLFAQAPASKQTGIISAIDEYIEFLDDLEEISNTRMQRLIDESGNISTSGTPSTTSTSSQPGATDTSAKNTASRRRRGGGGNMAGPGVYLAMFEHLLNNTPITPDTPTGPPRRGKDVKSELGHGKTEAKTGPAGPGAADSQSTPEGRDTPGKTPSIRSISSSSSKSSSAAGSSKKKAGRPQGSKAGSTTNTSSAAGSGGASGSETSSITSNLTPEPPDVSVVIDALGGGFQKLVAEISLRSLPPAARGEKE